MEQGLRKISKYCFGIIIFLAIFWVYRLPHSEDYKYDENTIFGEIEVVDSTLEILELDLGQYAFGTNEYYIFKAPSPSSRINFQDGFVHLDGRQMQEYNKFAYRELGYYSYTEGVIYDAKIPQSELDKINVEIHKTKAKSRYFRFYYSISDKGETGLRVMEEFHGWENKNREDIFIYSCSYQAKRVDMTDNLTSDLEKYMSIPLTKWSEISDLKYNWMVMVDLAPNRSLKKIESNSFVSDSYSNKTMLIDEGENKAKHLLRLKTIPKYIIVNTLIGDTSTSSTKQIIVFDLDDLIDTFNTAYSNSSSSELSLISIEIDNDGFVVEPIIIERGDKKIVLPVKEIKEWW